MSSPYMKKDSSTGRRTDSLTTHQHERPTTESTSVSTSGSDPSCCRARTSVCREQLAQPVMRYKATSGDGKLRRQALSSLPSSRTSRGPAAPTSWARVHEVDHVAQRGRRQFGIGVEQQRVARDIVDVSLLESERAEALIIRRRDSPGYHRWRSVPHWGIPGGPCPRCHRTTRYPRRSRGT